MSYRVIVIPKDDSYLTHSQVAVIQREVAAWQRGEQPSLVIASPVHVAIVREDGTVTIATDLGGPPTCSAEERFSGYTLRIEGPTVESVQALYDWILKDRKGKQESEDKPHYVPLPDNAR